MSYRCDKFGKFEDGSLFMVRDVMQESFWYLKDDEIWVRDESLYEEIGDY